MFQRRNLGSGHTDESVIVGYVIIKKFCVMNNYLPGPTLNDHADWPLTRLTKVFVILSEH